MISGTTIGVAALVAVLGNVIGWMVAGRRLVPLYLSPFALTFHCTGAAWVVTVLGTLVVRGSAVQRLCALGLIGALIGLVVCGEWLVRSAAQSRGRSTGGRSDNGTHETSQFLVDRARFEQGGSRYRNTRRRRENFSSPTLNFRDGWRVIPERESPVDASASRVIVFGGSTVVCIEVADGDTLAAQLDRHLHSRGSNRQVLNRGVMGATLRASWRLLRVTPLRRGDVALVYFGANDVNVAGLFGGPARGVLRGIPRLGGLLRAVGDIAGLRIAHVVARWLVTTDPDRLAREAERRADDVARVIRRVIRHCHATGVHPMVILQPHALVSGGTRHATAGDHSSVSTAFVGAAVRQYERIRQRCAGDTEFHDLSWMLSDEPTTDVYVDWMHLTARGNAMVASAIAELLVRIPRHE